MKLMQKRACLGGVLAFALCIAAAPARAIDVREEVLAFAIADRSGEFSVGVPEGWSMTPERPRNSRNFVNVPAGDAARPAAHVQVFFEPRLDHADAVRQMGDFAALAGAGEKRFLEIGGWPAMEIMRLEWHPKPDNAQSIEDLQYLRMQTWIAAGDDLIKVSGTLPAGAASKLVEETRALAASLRFGRQGDPMEVSDALDALRAVPDAVPGRRRGAQSEGLSGPRRVIETPVSDGANARINSNGFGELEIATDPTGTHVVVALQGRRFVSSNDGGATFPNSGRPGGGNGDPSVAWAQSGRFYIAWIDSGCGTNYLNPVVAPDNDMDGNPDATPNGLDCTGIARSDDDGVSFQTNTVNPAVVCIGRAPGGSPPNNGECFPDQEHIAADPVNPGDTPGDDQVYSTWRNFSVGDQNANLVCTSDSGVSWTPQFDIGPGEVFPRITVGQDGFVYVASYDGLGMFRLYKFTSCVNGLNPVAGFPVNVAARDAFQCPFAGHDRCDQNPTSQTVAVDDTDPTRVYYAYADDSGNGASGNSDIVVRESTDGGLTFPSAVLASAPAQARRIFPWLCTTGGDAVVTWYEQLDPDQSTAAFELSETTHYHAGRVGPNSVGTLVAKEAFVISEVTDDWCTIGWPCNTRWGFTDTQLSNASEACPNQPQLAGVCGDGDNPNVTADSNIACDFSDDDGVTFTNCLNPGPSGNPERCLPTAGGCPKYGDYNGNACTGGKLFGAWPSVNQPAGVPGPNSGVTGVLFDVVNLDGLEVPIITVPGNVHFGDTCIGSTSFATLDVCNTGGANLQVDVITSDNPDFEVTVPSSGYPVTISPDFCFPFEVSFTPSTLGPATATLTIPSDDPDRPEVEVEATGNAEEQDITTIMDTDYGDVCLGDAATQVLTILNEGGCDLTVSDVDITGADASEFELAMIMSTPFTLAAGESVSIDVEFIPAGDVGAADASIEITSDDPDTPVKVLSIGGNSPAAVVSTFIANSGAFGEVCAGSFADLNLTVQNDGDCPLEIDGVTTVLGANAMAGDFVQPAGNAAGSVVEPGNSVQVPIRFSPSAFDVDPPLVRQADVEVDSHTHLASSALPTDTTPVSGVVPPPDINVAIANSGDFGNVCKGDHADLDLTLFNQGRCDLTISDISLIPDMGSFELPADLQFPLVLSHDADFTVPVRFAPEECFDDPEMRTIKITSDDPDEMMVNIDISGTSPCPNLIIDPVSLDMLYAFPTTVVDSTGSLGCFNDRSAVLRNSGLCPLTIDSITAAGVSGDPLDYAVIAPTVFPIILPTGEETLTATVRFTPQADDDPLAPSEVTGLLTVVSDDPDMPHTANLCGESSAQSGVRILVTDVTSGTPVNVDEVDSINLSSKGRRRPSPVNITWTDQPWFSTQVCANTVEYHVDQETIPATHTTGSDPNSSYQAKAKEGNLQISESFSLHQCEFRDFQLQLQDSDGEPCILKPKGASCETGGECCSGRCRGKSGSKVCK